MVGRLNAYAFYSRIACNLLPLLAFAIAELVRFGGYIVYSSTEYDPISYFRLLIVATIIWSVVAEHYELTGPEKIARGICLRTVVAACSATYMILFAALFFYRDVSVSRIFLTVSAASIFGGALALQQVLSRTLRIRIANEQAVRILVIGTDDYAARTAARLREVASPRCLIVGYVRLAGQDVVVDGAPIHSFDELDDLALDDRMDDVLVAISPARWEQLREMMPSIERLCAPVRAVLDVPGFSMRERIVHFGGVHLIDLTATPLDSIHYLLFKRAADILLAFILLLVSSPMMLAIAVAVKLSSRGPIFFIQDRVGLNGKIFRMYKFRTMRVADVAESDMRWTTPQDRRCTRLGAFLRHTSLDELPQFFNVLKGDMSVVGPRPERPHFVRKFLSDVARYNTRHSLKVGITGWAQVNGWRGDTSIVERVEHDLYYLQHWSLAFDLRIILMTIWTCFFGKNAY